MAEPDNWEDEGFEPEEPVAVSAVSDKWAGEDEEDVKDNWDEEDEEAKEGEQAVAVKKKKSLKDRIAEKEAKRAAELAEKRKKEEDEKKKMSPEEALAERLRQQKMQEDSDLALAMEAFGVKTPASGQIDGFMPVTKEQFDTFQNLLKDKITPFEKSTYYVSFLENLYRDLAVGLEPDDVKKLASTLNTLGNEKTKAQKGKSKKKKGPKLLAGKETDTDSYGDVVYEDYDDFI